MEISPLAHGMAKGIVLQELIRGLGERGGIVKGNKDTASIGKQLLRMPIGRGDNRLAGAERDGEGAGNDLGFVPIRGDVNVRRADVLDQLFGSYKAVVEDDVGRNPDIPWPAACSSSL